MQCALKPQIPDRMVKVKLNNRRNACMRNTQCICGSQAVLEDSEGSQQRTMLNWDGKLAPASARISQGSMQTKTMSYTEDNVRQLSLSMEMLTTTGVVCACRHRRCLYTIFAGGEL
mmetsp:Transcript_161502/g.518572  ORF Transcript_161502/g.518572 Transcript_161502/m.518572 type:complete len:116 (+) Transcript_161502:124-471(+)